VKKNVPILIPRTYSEVYIQAIKKTEFTINLIIVKRNSPTS
jgi:hypothetical protein